MKTSTERQATAAYLEAFELMRRRAGLVAALEWASRMVDHAQAQAQVDLARLERSTAEH